MLLDNEGAKMNRKKLLRTYIRIKRRKQAILATGVLLVLVTVYQNCGMSTTSSSLTAPAKGTTGTSSTTSSSSTEPVLSAITATYTFANATGSAPYTFIIQNTGAAVATNISLSATLSSGFSISSDLCSNTQVAVGTTCTITVSYSNSSSYTESGLININYTDLNGVKQNPFSLLVSGPSGTGSATSAGIYIPKALYLSTHTSGGVSYHALRGAATRSEIALSYKNQYDASMVPLLRCKTSSPNRFFTTTSFLCENVTGAVVDSIKGWVHPTQNANEIALYRYYNSKTGDHFDSTQQVGTSGVPSGSPFYGYVIEKILGYLLPIGGTVTPPNQVIGTQTTSLYQIYCNNTGQHIPTLSPTQYTGTCAPDGKTVWNLYPAYSDSNMVPLFYCLGVSNKNWNSFLSNNLQCDALPYARPLAILGWVHVNPQLNEVALNRFYKSITYTLSNVNYTNSDYLYTSDIATGLATGYVFQKTLGYAAP